MGANGAVVTPYDQIIDRENDDPELRICPNLTGQVVPLFDPLRENWLRHFRAQGAAIEGTTPAGRATARVLSMNDARPIELRALLVERRPPVDPAA